MPRTWLSAGVFLVLALGFSGAFIRLKTCVTCDGLAGATQPPIRVDCPDCFDRGRTSLFRSWRPRVEAPVAKIVRGCRDVTRIQALLALKEVIRANGEKPETFIFEDRGGLHQSVVPRFVEVDRKQYLILLIDCPPLTFPDYPSVTVLLLSLRGQVHDRVDLLETMLNVGLEGRVLDGPASDGARITINPAGQKAEPYAAYRIYQWKREMRQEFPAWARASGFTDLCRLAIREDRLEVVSPHRK